MEQDVAVESPENRNIDPATEMAAVASEALNIAANNIVKNHIIASISLGLVPVPLFDLAALTAVQMNLLRSLSEHYGVAFDDSSSKPLLTALVGGSLPVLGIVGLSSLTKLIPGVGSLVGSASLGVTAGAVTYAVGQVFIMHFEAGGNLENFEPKQAKTFFEREFTAGKAFVQSIREELKAAKESKPEADKADSGSTTS